MRAIRARPEEVPRPPTLTSVKPIVFVDVGVSPDIAPHLDRGDGGIMQGKTPRAFLELKKRPGSNQPVSDRGKRYVDAVPNGLLSVQEIEANVLAVCPY